MGQQHAANGPLLRLPQNATCHCRKMWSSARTMRAFRCLQKALGRLHQGQVAIQSHATQVRAGCISIRSWDCRGHHRRETAHFLLEPLQTGNLVQAKRRAGRSCDLCCQDGGQSFTYKVLEKPDVSTCSATELPGMRAASGSDLP